VSLAQLHGLRAEPAQAESAAIKARILAQSFGFGDQLPRLDRLRPGK